METSGHPEMASSKDAHAVSDTDLAQISEAWLKIVQGEKTAQALESNLTSLEKKIDDLLASFEESERLKVEEPKSKEKEASVGGSKEAKS